MALNSHNKLLQLLDERICVQAKAHQNTMALWAQRSLACGFLLFALSLPHSIAASYISLSICLVSWGIRDLAQKRFQFQRSPFDLPLWCFIGLTVLSAFASVEPAISIRKLGSLIVFVVLYLCTSNLQRKAIPILCFALLFSALTGVVYSLGEKIFGRGIIVAQIAPESPLAQSALQNGDVIWMVKRQRVRSVAQANQIIQQTKSGRIIEIEALHAGDPLPVEIHITDALKQQPNPLGITAEGSSRRFRVSGFSRHFLTYAEQMQLFALFLFGLLLARPQPVATTSKYLSFAIKYRVAGLSILCALFALTLLLTATRGVIAAYLGAVMLTAALMAQRRIALMTLGGALLLGICAVLLLSVTRNTQTTSFKDDSTMRRVGYMKAGLKIIPQHPLLGVGMDAHKQHWAEWGFPGDYITHTHSTPIQIAMDRGLPALGCYFWLLGSMGWFAWQQYRNRREWLGLSALAVLFGFFLSALTNYNFGDAEILMLVLLLFGLLTKTRDE